MNVVFNEKRHHYRRRCKSIIAVVFAWRSSILYNTLEQLPVGFCSRYRYKINFPSRDKLTTKVSFIYMIRGGNEFISSNIDDQIPTYPPDSIDTLKQEAVMYPGGYINFHHVAPTLLLPAFEADIIINRMKKLLEWFTTNILWYQPPVGLVSTIVICRLILSGRIFSIYDKKTLPSILNGKKRKMKGGIDNQGYDDDFTVSDHIYFQQQENSNRKQKEYRGRSFKLDSEDAFIDKFGEIQHVRTQLCIEAISNNELSSSTKQEEEAKNVQSNQKPSNHFDVLMKRLHNLLKVTHQPKRQRLDFIHESIYHFSRLEHQLANISQFIRSTSNLNKKLSSNVSTDLYYYFLHQQKLELLSNTTTSSIINFALLSNTTDLHDIVDVIEIAILTSEIRLLDSMLRLCRDQLLKSTYRLAKTVEYWSGRVKRRNRHSVFTMIENLFWTFVSDKNTVSNQQKHDRVQLSYAHAVYKSELERLGIVLRTLMAQPSDLPDTVLSEALAFSAIKKSIMKPDVQQTPKSIDSHSLKSHNDRPDASYISSMNRSIRQLINKSIGFSLPNFFKYNVRWRGDGKGFFTIRKLDLSDITISQSAAIGTLLAHHSSSTNFRSQEASSFSHEICNHRLWNQEAQVWTSSARQTLCQIVKETVAASIETHPTVQGTNESLFSIEKEWCDQRPHAQRNSTIIPNEVKYEQNWKRLVQYVDNLSKMRRTGEGQEIRFKDAFGTMYWLKKLDIFGIPSSLVTVAIAFKIYDRSHEPYWMNVQKEVFIGYWKLLEIIYARFWIPLVGIYDDIMNKSPSMMSAFGLDVEEESLDRMLKDLGYGDGTPLTRQEALKLVTLQYENDVITGLFTNIMSGRLIKLQLIQMQQLKVGMLSALDTIDVLLKGNRIHFQFLAAIPAILIATYGTRYFLRGLYNVRAKDIRPVTAVHEEMNNYLSNVEQILLLSSDVNIRQDPIGRNISYDIADPTNSMRERKIQLTPEALGDITLNLHRYLILMDFCCPPFQISLCDEIHHSLQGLTGIDGTLWRLDSERNIKWLQQIKSKHHNLLKGL